MIVKKWDNSKLIIPKNEITSRIMSAVKSKNTKPEIKLRKALYHNGLSGYRLHWKKAIGRPDISYPGRKIAIFVNGCFWHSCPRCKRKLPKSNTEFWKKKLQSNVIRDKKVFKELNKQGWKVIVIWECQINKKLNICVDVIKKSVLDT